MRSRAGNAAEVACRGASEPLDGAASRWHEARSEAEGANTHGGLQGHADAPLPGRMSPSRCKFEELDKYKFAIIIDETKEKPKDGHCPRCGSNVRVKDRYCSHCGEKL